MNSISFTNISEGRYDRQELISWWDQKKVSGARVIVAGAGALGNEVLKNLALMGAGHITLIDFDDIAPSNLARMVLFRESDIGRPKVEAAAESLKKINPHIQVRAVKGDLRTAIGLGDYREADLIFGCLDSINARWALNRKCLQAGKEWIDGGISDFHGLVARYGAENSACYECGFTAQRMERFNQRYSCPFGLVNIEADEKVPTTAITTSVIASIQVQQGFMMLHGLQDGLKPGEKLTVYLKPFMMVKDQLPYHPECMAHGRLPDESLSVPYRSSMTVDELFNELNKRGAEAEKILLPSDYVVKFLCAKCGGGEQVLRIKEHVQQALARCPTCGDLRVPEIISSIEKNSPQAGLNLDQLEIPENEILGFSNGSATRFLILSAALK